MGHPEDVELARAVPEIDVIVASHTHDIYLEAVGPTLVVQSYRQGMYLRCMPLRARFDIKQQRWRVSLRSDPASTLVTVDDGVAAYEGTMRLVEEIKAEVDRVLKASTWGGKLAYSKPIYSAPTATALFGHNWTDAQLASVVGDCLVDAINSRNVTSVKLDLFLGLAGMVRGFPREVKGWGRVERMRRFMVACGAICIFGGFSKYELEKW